jgi:hypothetical protein
MNISEILDEIEKAYPPDVFPDTTQKERGLVVVYHPGFIDCTSAMMGRHLVKVIREKLALDAAWRERYEKRLIARGFTRQDAHESAQAADNPDNEDPEDAADDEASYTMTE